MKIENLNSSFTSLQPYIKECASILTQDLKISLIAFATLALFVIYYIQKKMRNKKNVKVQKPLKEDLEKVADVFYNKITTVEEAKVIFIGEAQAYKPHRKLEVEIIERLARDDDIVLIEGLVYKDPPMMNINFYEIFNLLFGTYEISKKVQLNGWESDKKTIDSRSDLDQAMQIIAECIENETEENKVAICVVCNSLAPKISDLKLKQDNFMLNLVKNLSEKHPNRKIFVIASKGHILTQKPKPYFIFDYLKEMQGVAVVLKGEGYKKDSLQIFYQDIDKEVDKLFLSQKEKKIITP